MDLDEEPVRVLLTGFGPFGDFAQNPSWEAARLLHDRTLTSPPGRLPARRYRHSESIPPMMIDSGTVPPTLLSPRPTRKARKVHVTAAQVPVSYRKVHELVPPLHGVEAWTSEDWERGSTSTALEHLRAPSPADADKAPAPAHPPFDLIVHTGVCRPSRVKIETRARRWGYDADCPDAQGDFPPSAPLDIVRGRPPAPQQRRSLSKGCIGASRLEPGCTYGFVGDVWDACDAPEETEEEMTTLVDTKRVLQRTKETLGIGPFLTESRDPGSFVCEHLYFASMASARRRARALCRKDVEAAPVLFIHVPPLDDPFTLEETALIVQSLIWNTVNA